MRPRFRKRESVQAGLARIAGAYADTVQARLGGEGLTEDDVHEVRVTLKRLRAVWRLVRPHVQAARFRSLNDLLRDAGRTLSGSRDMHVAAQTLAELLGRTRKAEAREAIGQVASSIASHAADEHAQVAADPLVGRALAEARAAFASLDLPRSGWAALEPGLGKTYTQARKRLAKGRKAEDGLDAALHELRKRVKDLGYQLELLVPAAPAPLGAMLKLARRTGRRLGQAHDAAMTRELLLAEDAARTVGDADAVAMTLRRLDNQRDRLAQRSMKLAGQLLADPPADWLGQPRGAWRRWRPDDRVQ